MFFLAMKIVFTIAVMLLTVFAIIMAALLYVIRKFSEVSTDPFDHEDERVAQIPPVPKKPS